MTATVLELRPGCRVWLDGSVWVIQEVGGDTTRLVAGTRTRSMATSLLASQAGIIDASGSAGEDQELIPVLLGSLTDRELELERRAGHVREVLSAPPGASKSRRKLRYAAKATELGVSTRTFERWVAGYLDAGVAGVADNRMLQRRASGVDPRWDTACLAVVADLTTASTPTMGTVIERIERELEAAHWPGIVPLPSRATAYRRLGHLTKGRHSFGSGKVRRSVAERPQGVYGRLTATRPGEFVVLDTIPLDVFAMEPVTLRWVPVELTVAMDLFDRCIVGLRLQPVSTKSQDVANVLFQAVTPQSRTPLTTKLLGGRFTGCRAMSCSAQRSRTGSPSSGSAPYLRVCRRRSWSTTASSACRRT